MPRVLIAGVSTRGFAESAARAGYEVVAVDGYGDLDLVARAAVVRVARVRGGGGSARAPPSPPRAPSSAMQWCTRRASRITPAPWGR